MGHARASGDSTQTLVAYGGSEGDREAARDFSDGVGRLSHRPVSTEFARNGAGRSPHAASVSQPFSSFDDTASARFEEVLESYVPQMPEHLWAELRPSVLGWMRRLGVNDLETTKRTLRNIAQLAQHSLELGWGLSEQDVFSEELIEHFAKSRPGRDGKPRASDLSVLRRVRRTLLRPETSYMRLAPAQLRLPSPPFSAAEVSAAEQWAVTRKDRDNRRTASAIIALGLGCGLRSQEMIQVSVRTVVQDEHGLTVDVDGRRVPVLARWEPLLALALDLARGEDALIGVDGPTDRPKYVSGYLQAQNGPEHSRLRSTWLLSHLEWGTPVDLLLAISGNKDLGWLMPYLPLIDRDAGSADRLLRASGAVR